MLVDSFIFYNELDLLEYRLTVLGDIVDYFVLVEATHTIQADPKPLFFADNKDRYQKWLHKIIHIVIEDMPNSSDTFVNETFQRNCIDRGIKQLNLSDDDLLMISDADEIANPKLLGPLKNIKLIDMYILLQDYYMYSLNYKLQDQWHYFKIMPFHIYRDRYFSKPQICREIQEYQDKDTQCNYITKGGWHFSYFGKPEVILQKIHAFSLGSKNVTMEELKGKLTNGLAYYTNQKMAYTDIDYTIPNLDFLLNLKV